MSLINEIERARRQVKTDFYAMSIGEIATMYENRELVINPSFQRLFRWEQNQKSKFIESILLGIPVPPIFVFETDRGQWELIDGLQRISTILEFMGLLITDSGVSPPSALIGTIYLPSLKNTVWRKSDRISDVNINAQLELDKSFPFEFRRSRIIVQILKRSSDEDSKYDLFQRLNSGGTIAEPQEVRNCAVIMSNESFFRYSRDLATSENFMTISRITHKGIKIQKHLEYVMRFFVFEHFDFDQNFDVEEFIDDRIIEISKSENVYLPIGEIFRDVCAMLNEAFGNDALRRYDPDIEGFVGQVGIVALEGIVVGIARNFHLIGILPDSIDFVRSRIRSYWSEPDVRAFSASGVSGSTRLTKTIAFGENHFRP